MRAFRTSFPEKSAGTGPARPGGTAPFLVLCLAMAGQGSPGEAMGGSSAGSGGPRAQGSLLCCWHPGLLQQVYCSHKVLRFGKRW